MAEIRGTGTLIDEGGREFGAVEYTLNIVTDRRGKSARGTMSCAPGVAFLAFTEGGHLSILQENGFLMRVVLSQVTGDGSSATILVSGPPGPGY